MNILLCLITLTMQRDVVVIKGIPGCPPSRICEMNGLDDVVANAQNLPYLISILRNNCIDAAAVAGWNDHLCYDLVLRANGALAPFQQLTNYADHAFCIQKGHGCRREPVCGDSSSSKQSHRPCPPQPMPCPPQPCPPQPKPMPCPPQPCPPRPRPMPCPPQPKPCPPKPMPIIKCESSSSSSSSSCSSSSSSSSSSSESEVCSKSSSRSRSSVKKYEKCPKYVKQKKNIYKNCNPRDKCRDRVNFAVENIRIVKTFIFNEKDLCDKRRVKFREVTDKATNLFKWVELRPLLDGKRLTKEGYPALLRFPGFLYALKRYIQCKYKYMNPCLYLDCKGKLYVRIRDTLYLVKFRRNVKFSEKHAFKYIKLCPVRGKKLDCLINEGLAGIVFERSVC